MLQLESTVNEKEKLHAVTTNLNLSFPFPLQQCNDVMLMSYLATLTKGCNSLNEVCPSLDLCIQFSCCIVNEKGATQHGQGL